MSYLLYNFLWKIIDYFLINYLNFRVDRGKEIKSRLNERFGKCYIRKENKKIFGYMAQVLENQLLLLP